MYKGAVTRASFWQFSANTGVRFCQYWRQKVREASHDHRCFPTSIGIFAAASFYRLWLLKTKLADQNKQNGQRLQMTYNTYGIKFVAVKPSHEEETYFHLFVYTDFQNCRRSSAQSRTKTKNVNKDASIGGKNDGLWRSQFCYRYWQKNASIGRKKCHY